MDSVDTAIEVAEKISGGEPLLFLLVLLVIAGIAATFYLWKITREDTKSRIDSLSKANESCMEDMKQMTRASQEIIMSNIKTLESLENHLDNVRTELPRMSSEVRQKIENSEVAVKTHITSELSRLAQK